MQQFWAFSGFSFKKSKSLDNFVWPSSLNFNFAPYNSPFSEYCEHTDAVLLDFCLSGQSKKGFKNSIPHDTFSLPLFC